MAKSVKIKPRKIRGQQRFCVESDGNKRAKGFKGRGSTKRFHGCFLRPADAKRRATKVSRSR